MSPGPAALVLTALLVVGCGADRTAPPAGVSGMTTGPAPPPTDAPGLIEPAVPPPRTEASTMPTADETPSPTPTARVIGPAVPPSDAARRCTEAGLVAAALDACLRYETARCTPDSIDDECELAREQLEVVLGTRIFPGDCGELGADELAGAPPWCDTR